MLEQRARRFLEAWNAHDLDLVMSFIADDAVYEDPSGVSHEGRDAIRTAFAGTLDGSRGAAHFLLEDVVPASGAVTLTWTCELVHGGQRRSWQGIDLLRFDEEGLVASKRSYAKARLILLRPL